MSWPQPNRGPCRERRALDVRERKREREGGRRERGRGERLTFVLSSSRHHPQGENLPLKGQSPHHHRLLSFSYHPTYCHHHFLMFCYIHNTAQKIQNHIKDNISRVAQWERAGPITQRSMDRNHPLLISFLFLFILPFLLIHFVALLFLRLLSWCYKVDNKLNKFGT